MTTSSYSQAAAGNIVGCTDATYRAWIPGRRQRGPAFNSLECGGPAPLWSVVSYHELTRCELVNGEPLKKDDAFGPTRAKAPPGRRTPRRGLAPLWSVVSYHELTRCELVNGGATQEG